MERRRRSKIIATLGPATDQPGVLERMIRAGVDAVRINCSHGHPQQWLARTQAIRDTAQAAGRYVAVLFDLQGPKIRLAADVRERDVAAGERVVFIGSEDDRVDDADVLVVWEDVARAVTPGRSELVVGDGVPRFAVERASGGRITARCSAPGRLIARKGLAVTHADADLPALTDKDLADLDVAARADADFVALSFVRSAADVFELREEIARRGIDAQVVAKIEKVEAFENLERIVAAADGVMVARGDLGVEAGVPRVPLMQKEIIRAAVADGKLVITATQMLESMIHSPEPTRAEAADVANAIIDGSSAVMLSAETATGAYPVEAVETMAEIARQAEGSELYSLDVDHPEDGAAAVMQAAVLLGRTIDADALVVPTSSGGSVRAAAKYRPRRLIIGLALCEKVARQLALEWGTVPGVVEKTGSVEEMIERAMDAARRLGGLDDGSQVVLTYGPAVDRPGATNMIVARTIGG